MSGVFIVRHGNTFSEGEPVRRIGARMDLPLTDGGIQQVEVLADWFARHHLPFTHIVTGPLQRTRQTAEIIGSRQKQRAQVEIASWLAEIDHGPDEGAVEAAVVARIGEGALRRWDEEGVPPEGWVVDVNGRIAAWQRLFADLPANGLVVTSNGSARFALLALPLLLRPATLTLRTAAYGRIERRAGGDPCLTAWNARPD